VAEAPRRVTPVKVAGIDKATCACPYTAG
jgi:hypothetical protein